jgi:hypothetical protein
MTTAPSEYRPLATRAQPCTTARTMGAVPGKPTRYAGQYRRRPDPQTGELPLLLCSVDGCKQPVQARGFCPKHYRRLMRHGDPLARK